MTDADRNRCWDEFRCFWCKVAMPDRHNRHQSKDCPVRLSGRTPAPMPALAAASQDARREGNGSGRPRQ
jgi:hypothetical protein